MDETQEIQVKAMDKPEIQAIDKPEIQATRKPQESRERNTVFIGKKGVMSYVLAVVTQFNSGSNRVAIKARGRAISRAVDTAEIVRSRFVTNAEIKGIKISTEEVKQSSGDGMTKVSAIEITLGR